MEKFICAKIVYEANGEQKTMWQRLGRLYDNEGKLSGRITTIPVGWDGRIYVFDNDDSDGKTPTKPENSNSLPF